MHSDKAKLRVIEGRKATGPRTVRTAGLQKLVGKPDNSWTIEGPVFYLALPADLRKNDEGH